MNSILPGSTIGILGGGQLGRFLALVAIDRGYRVHGFAPEPDAPLASVCEKFVCGSFDDTQAISEFCQGLDVLTVEFENIPATALETAQAFTRVHPSASVLRVAQHRLREKEFLHTLGIPTAPWAPVRTTADLTTAWSTVGTPGILKTAASGYDGKGQVAFTDFESLERAWEQLQRVECVAEKRIDLQVEISVLVARRAQGEITVYRPIENHHQRGILDVSHWPAQVSDSIAARVMTMASSIAEAIGMVGVLCVECFVDPAGDVFVNELAPRPHNSGHLTMEAADTSQFEQQLRAICGLSLGSPEMRIEASMVNLLGDLWGQGIPAWNEVWKTPRTYLHLYGKDTAKPGRKMGHLTAVGGERSVREAELVALRQKISRASV